MTYHEIAITSHNHIEANELVPKSDCASSSHDTLVYRLARPSHIFHSNHWYHLGEYYLSQINNISAYPTDSQSRNVIILVYSPAFLQHITPMTMFFLILSFRIHGGITKLTILSDSDDKQLLPVVHGRISWVRSDIYFQYRNVSQYDEQFILNKQFVRQTMTDEIMPKCFDFGGTYGYAPINTTKWFQSSEQVAYIRTAIDRMCPINRNPFPKKLMHNKLLSYQGRLVPYVQSSKKRKVVVYQRDVTRMFYRFESILRNLYAKIGDQWHIDVVFHDEQSHPCMLQQAFQGADLYVTAHGFESLGTVLVSNAVLRSHADSLIMYLQAYYL
jgi:hypothetical protein